jgi:hypothetical protein
MGRPRELTEAERQKLIAEGYRPVEVWLPDLWSDELWQQIEEDCRLIRESDRRTGMMKTLDAFAEDLWDELD